ncbi:unnamed protein product [Zymoseptoria tritici ST99CH_3D1]|uniref:Uncharacterized protein n=2 Tax=Zymoseptoria tritici TaxID=1047171 RepID=F9X7V9_ZYMTI|nr:uncharacterized protein MYCGRDRAFT_108738 [Zymoseptoria tritici IPO323]EGP88943.1 hypothetical protein MYCGRDRAFT_108738 [Zymoseptoria tritici IPO323]SMR50109.1 unnamed protein product [Zymoseptoria tritici ST99CH_3D1]
MLVRCIQRNQRRILSASLASPSKCRPLEGPQWGIISAKRHAATRVRAPSTVDRESYKLRALSPADQRRMEELEYKLDTYFHEACANLYATGVIQCLHTDAFKFLKDFKELHKKTKTVHQPFANPARLVELMNFHNVNFDDAETLARTLLVYARKENAPLGKKLLYSLSWAGHENSTLRILGHAVKGDKTGPVLRSCEIAWARQHLTKIANEPGSKNYRAMTLEGKIARELREDTYAIEMWNKAIGPAVEASKIRLAKLAAPQKPKKGEKVDTLEWREERDPEELSSPWIELTLMHWKRGDFDLSKEAIKIGCEQDDPLSHYHRADFIAGANNINLEGDNAHAPVVSAWLYNITKAATSGIASAAHQLGLFYMKVGWKYISDEPPDRIKPTPFDSYPAPFAPATTFDRIRQFIGFQSTRPMTQEESVFHSTNWPFEPEQRYAMARLWLREAAYQGYAPAYLDLAKLCMKKTLWTGLRVPKAAQEMSSERYTHASKAKYDAANGDGADEADTQPQVEPVSSRDDKARVPNKWYSPKSAKSWLVEIFHCHKAHEEMQAKLAQYRRDVRRKWEPKLADEDDAISEQRLAKKGLDQHLTKWFKNPEVREQYEDRLPELYSEAKRICDKNRWNLYDSRNALLYTAR